MPYRADPGWASFADKTYAPGVVASGPFLFTSGLNPIDETGSLVAAGDIVGQTRQIYRRLGELLDHVGAAPSDVVKTTDYIVSRDGYRDTAAVRREFFGDGVPAATGVIVRELLGRGVLIEIEAIVRIPGAAT